MGSSFSSESGPNPNRNPQHHRPHYPPPPYYPDARPSPHSPHFHPSSSSNPAPFPSSQPPPENYGYPSSNPYPATTQYNHHYPPHIPTNYYHPGWQNSFNYGNPMMGRPNYAYPYGNLGNGWPPMGTPMNADQPPVYVDRQNAKVVKNDVNVHKDSIKLEVDENHPDDRLVSFVVDARFDGSITIFYLAKEDKKTGKFIPTSLKAPGPVKVPFQAGTGQKFCQPSGTGLDLSRHNLEALREPSHDGIIPLVIFAEVNPSAQAADDEAKESSESSHRAQITYAIIEREIDDSFQVKVIKQIVSIDGVHYEVRELYGIGSSAAEDFTDDEPGKECIICMTEPKTTAVIPCRHLCMCSDCAKELRLQSNKCPICRQPITELIEININKTDE